MRKTRLALARVNYSQLYEMYDDGKTYQKRDILPPYQLLTLAGYIRNPEIELKIFDGEVNLQTQQELAGDILEWNPDFVGLTATTPDIDLTVGVCDIIKDKNDSIVTIIGGPHASARPHDVAKHKSVDCVVSGDGEQALKSICCNSGSQPVLIGPTIDIKHNPEPAHDLIDYSKYTFSDPVVGLMRTASIMTTRGCPYKCNFCFHNRKLRFKDMDVVINEIIYLYQKEVRYFYIYDDTFFAKKQWVMETARRIKELQLSDIHFQCLTRGNLVDPYILEALRAVGFVRVSMGIESGSDDILKRAQKGVNTNDYVKACKLIHSFGIETRGSFIIGHPYETHDDINRTIEFSKQLELYHANFNIMTPYPGTEIYEMAKRGEGIRFSEPHYETTWSEYRRWGNSIIATDDLTANDLIELQKKCQVEFYTQPKIYDYYYKLFLEGNHASYFYRPLNFAWKNKYGKDIPFWERLCGNQTVDPKQRRVK